MATEREVTDAKLEAVEARMETRLVSIEGKLDRLVDQITSGLTQAVDAAKRAETAAERAEGKAEDARKAAGMTFWNILATGIAVTAVILAVAFGIFQVYTATTDNFSGMFGISSDARQTPPPPTGTEAGTPP